MPARLQRLIDRLAEGGWAGAALMPATNLAYLTGLQFHPGKRLTLLLIPASGAQPVMVVPQLELERVRAAAPFAMQYVAWSDAEGPLRALAAGMEAAFGSGAPAKPLAVEYTVMRVMELRALETVTPGLQTSDVDPLLSELRMVKDAEELALMERAVAIVEQALHVFIAQVRPGISERALSRMLSDAIIAAGADSESFANMMASGPNAANPHHENSDRLLQPGDLVIIDCGAVYHGYHSDITRTIAIGEPEPAARHVYEIVLAANAAGRAAARPGASGAEIDIAARNVIEAAGYGAAFVHRTGHGLGRETHELPNIVAGSDAPLLPGTTFTVEPGIYLPGRFGVRIEDDVVITAEGSRSLTTFPRELIVVEAGSLQ
ncbi:Xaa-Pro peptidase family protein [Chloroflexus sp.]|uniref:M24 family metallopeptidase n=1 Tax=Chloroflexus sp. TaxID=1904827 RepID=UPI002ACD3CCF|nr:Xaa-Pro peptidase family protein [Chloroflexus sp.]